MRDGDPASWKDHGTTLVVTTERSTMSCRVRLFMRIICWSCFVVALASLMLTSCATRDPDGPDGRAYAGSSIVLSGTVVDDQGHPIEGARVAVRGQDDHDLSAVVSTHSDGTFLVRGGAELPLLEVGIEAGGYVATRQSVQRNVRCPDRLHLVLDRSCSLEGECRLRSDDLAGHAITIAGTALTEQTQIGPFSGTWHPSAFTVDPTLSRLVDKPPSEVRIGFGVPSRLLGALQQDAAMQGLDFDDPVFADPDRSSPRSLTRNFRGGAIEIVGLRQGEIRITISVKDGDAVRTVLELGPFTITNDTTTLDIGTHDIE